LGENRDTSGITERTGEIGDVQDVGEPIDPSIKNAPEIRKKLEILGD